MSSAATVYQSLNLIAITCAALAGSVAARNRGLDPVGILSCACISGLGGGLLRDVLLQDGVPASIANPWNPAAAFAAGAVLCFASPRGAAWRVLAPVAEAATIGAWAAVTGTEKAAILGVAPFSGVLLGVVSATGGGAIRDVVVLRRVPEIFGGNTLTATCAAASAVLMIIAYRLHYSEAGLAGGTAVGGVLYLVARWRHWVLPSAGHLRAEPPSDAPNPNTPTQLRES